MKALVIAAALATLSGLAGCAEDGPTADEVQEQLRQGVTGQGQLTPGTDRGGIPHSTPGERDPEGGR